MKIESYASILALILGATATASADTSSIDFETPYTLGNLNSGTFSSGSAFDGQQGWANSSSSGRGLITNSVSSGLYSGGQVLVAGTANTDAYLGANNTFAWTGNVISFDLLAVFNEKVGVGGWTDLNSDGLYQQSEASAYGGLNTGGQFTLRGAGIGNDNLTGVNVILGDWYQVTLTYDDALSSITMDVINLTLGGSVVDLNGAADGTSFTHIFTGAAGDVYTPVSSFDGLFVRTTGLNVLDNIQIVATPEPSTLALAFLGGLGLLAIRRRV